MDERNLVDLLLKQAKHQPEQPALRFKKTGKYHDITWGAFRDSVIQIALSLKKAGIRKGDSIGLLSENRPEWAFADLGILSLGAVVIPIYPTASLPEIERILAHCETKTLFISTRDQLARIDSIIAKNHRIQQVILFETPHTPRAKVFSLEDFIVAVNPHAQSSVAEFDRLVDAVQAGDLATIIYTSGTTGPAKGVMLSHLNFLVNCHDALCALELSRSDLYLSFLPLSHVFERMGGYYLSLLCGAVIAYAENMNTVPENLTEVRPTIACSVPRFFEKMYGRIQAGIEQSGFLKKRLCRWALNVGSQIAQLRLNRQKIPALFALQGYIAERLVYSKIYQKLGGRLRCFISGGAPLPKELAEFFYAMGILILEGYGLTETSPVISVNRWQEFKFGSVGRPLPNVQVKIAEDGEILAQGPSIMGGYFKDEEATRKVLEGGWFHTGDLGRMDADGFLYVTGRKKDIIVTSGGKNISPQNIENLALSDPLISQIVIVGDRHHFITALIVPNFERLRNELKASGVRAGESPEEIIRIPQAHFLLRQHLEERMRDLASYEKIKYFTLLTKEFTQEKGEVTATMKIRRAVVSEHFHDAIERMYRETENSAYEEARNRIFFLA